jgi:hypothetical protein
MTELIKRRRSYTHSGPIVAGNASTLSFRPDHYDGVTIDSSSLPTDPIEFSARLKSMYKHAVELCNEDFICLLFL